MLNRQKVAVAMLRARGGTASRLQLTKWLYLLGTDCPSRGGSAFYQFVPYRYGPFSFSLYHEMGRLVSNGLVEEKEDGWWTLTDAGRQCPLPLQSPIADDVEDVLHRFGNLSPERLIDVVYSRDPWFTVKTQIPGRKRVPQPTASLAVYTLGYEGSMVEGFMNAIIKAGVQRIIDVRSNPTSRRYGFHQSTLSRIAGRLDLDYVQFPALGIPTADRVGHDGFEARKALLDRYEHEMLPRQSQDLSRLAKSLTEMPGVLICQEARSAECHRSRLADAVGPVAGLPIKHLGLLS